MPLEPAGLRPEARSLISEPSSRNNVDWSICPLTTKLAHLPPNGALIVYEALIDDARKKNAFGLLMSLNMLIETPGGFDFTGADCCKWMKAVGFKKTKVERLAGSDGMVVGYK